MLPRKTVVVEKEASIEVHDKTAIEFNNLLEISIIFGVGFGCLGGTLAAISLTIISLLPTGNSKFNFKRILNFFVFRPIDEISFFFFQE